MRAARTYTLKDGPWVGQTITTSANKIVLAEAPDMAYHRTRPTDTNWRETYDYDWWMHGLPEAPAVPGWVMEWHEVDWRSPEVTAIQVEAAAAGWFQ